MSLKVYRRKGSLVYHYRGTLAGHRLRGTTGTPDKETAAEVAAKVQEEFYKRRLHGDKEVLTFPKAAALYIAAGKSQRFLTPLLKYWGDAKVKDMTPGAIIRSAMEIYPKSGNASRNRQVIVPTQAIINHAAESELCSHIKIKRLKFETKKKKPILLDWIEKFGEHAERPEIKVLALFLYATGARISEALSVRWMDVDFKAKTVLIRQSKLGNERVAHLPMNIVVALANLPATDRPAQGKVFDMAYTTARDAWARSAKAAGLEGLTFHSCRHGFATTLLRRGVDVVTTAKLGGWKSPAHVFQTYGHAQDDATLTERLFDTQADTAAASSKQDQ
ncbi:MAG TPA: site-specific integrase [Gemmatimonadaceae bacterium]|nr:site-specific integrase [Gemmatimonadaceae bacterium]